MFHMTLTLQTLKMLWFDKKRVFAPMYHQLQSISILFTKSRGYSNIKKYNIFQRNVISLKQLVLISKVISRPI